MTSPETGQPNGGGQGTDFTERRQRVAGTHRALRAIKARHSAERTTLELFADRLSRIASSGFFLAFHVFWFGLWILYNVGALGAEPFDTFPFGLLTMVVSLEAIFLSIFVLMAQRRESSIAELREEITLQVLLRAEEEITKTLQLMAGLYPRLGHKVAEDPELMEMLRPLDPDEIERQLSRQIQVAAKAKISDGGKPRRSEAGAGDVPP